MFKKSSNFLKTENKQLKREVAALKLENAELKEANYKLEQSRQCTETRQQLSGALQERLTILEQVTAVTQRRQLLQEDFYENIPSGSDYEQLRDDPTEEHIYASIPTHTGRITVF